MGIDVGYSAKWKVLEDMMISLRRKGVEMPLTVVNDLRSAKLLIGIVDAEDSKGDALMKLEETFGSVESYLVSEAQNVLSDAAVDEWLKRLDEASISTCEAKPRTENKFITGVQRDQKWIRIEPIPNLPAEKLTLIAKENSLSVNQQKDGRLVVFGEQESIKAFLKKMTEQAQPKSKVKS